MCDAGPNSASVGPQKKESGSICTWEGVAAARAGQTRGQLILFQFARVWAWLLLVCGLLCLTKPFYSFVLVCQGRSLLAVRYGFTNSALFCLLVRRQIKLVYTDRVSTHKMQAQLTVPKGQPNAVRSEISDRPVMWWLARQLVSCTKHPDILTPNYSG